MTISLRPYQQDFINKISAEFQHHRRVVGVAPCGAGKTIMTGWMIKSAVENRHKRCIFFVHRRELIRQTSETFTRLDIPHGIIDANAPMQLNLPVQIASVQTLVKRLDKIPPPQFLICDECHHILANSYQKILDKFPNAWLLGVIATPQRMGGITLADAFDSMVESLTVNQLIELGNLTKFKYYAPNATIDLSKVRKGFGDYNQSDLAGVMSEPNIIGDIVADYQRLAEGKSAICYCVNVEHSKTVADAFNDAGIPAAHCDGETPAVIRAHITEQFKRGDIKILCNAELFGEGFDVPNMQAVILARPTQSLTLYIQQALRPLRPDPNDPNKVAVIIDHVKNYLKHGLPNANHDWSLIPNNSSERKCPHCGEFITPKTENGRKFCPECGYVFEKGTGQGFGERKAVTGAGDLHEVNVRFDSTPEFVTSVKKKPTTIEEFKAIAEEKGYKIYWAACHALKYAKTLDAIKHIGKVCGYKRGWAQHKFEELKMQKALQTGSQSC